METEYYIHPRRFPKNVAGPFYTLGDQRIDGSWCGECLSCDMPESLAPTLLSPLTDDDSDTYFVRQPETEDEIKQACEALRVCCVGALRYGGKDPAILGRLGADVCDFTSPPWQVRDDIPSSSTLFEDIDPSFRVFCVVMLLLALGIWHSWFS